MLNSLESFQNRKIYTSFDEMILREIPDDKLEQAIFDYILGEIGEDFTQAYKVVSGLSKGMQAVFTTWVVETDVNNGGFHQYYWNSSGEFSLKAIEGFKQIGAMETAEIMVNSIALAINEIPEIKRYLPKEYIENTQKKLYKYSRLEELDEWFFKDNENISKLRIKYIRSNPQLFTSKN